MKLLFLFISLGLLSSCVTEGEDTSDSATYRVTITSNWNAADHLGLPSNAHFSPVVAVSHNEGYALLPVGERASAGLELVAELGRTSSIETELDQAQDDGSVSSVVITEDQFVNSQTVQEFEVTVSKSHPYFSFVSMIAPSPDWVIGLNALKLSSNDGSFIDGIAPTALFAYDAGTESGDFGGNFSINNSATSPQDTIGRLRGAGFDTRFATVEIDRIN